MTDQLTPEEAALRKRNIGRRKKDLEMAEFCALFERYLKMIVHLIILTFGSLLAVVTVGDEIWRKLIELWVGHSQILIK